MGKFIKQLFNNPMKKQVKETELIKRIKRIKTRDAMGSFIHIEVYKEKIIAELNK